MVPLVASHGKSVIFFGGGGRGLPTPILRCLPLLLRRSSLSEIMLSNLFALMIRKQLLMFKQVIY